MSAFLSVAKKSSSCAAQQPHFERETSTYSSALEHMAIRAIAMHSFLPNENSIFISLATKGPIPPASYPLILYAISYSFPNFTPFTVTSSSFSPPPLPVDLTRCARRHHGSGTENIKYMKTDDLGKKLWSATPSLPSPLVYVLASDIHSDRRRPPPLVYVLASEIYSDRRRQTGLSLT